MLSTRDLPHHPQFFEMLCLRNSVEGYDSLIRPLRPQCSSPNTYTKSKRADSCWSRRGWKDAAEPVHRFSPVQRLSLTDCVIRTFQSRTRRVRLLRRERIGGKLVRLSNNLGCALANLLSLVAPLGRLWPVPADHETLAGTLDELAVGSKFDVTTLPDYTIKGIVSCESLIRSGIADNPRRMHAVFSV